MMIGNWSSVDKALEEIGIIDLGIGEIASSLGRKLHELIDKYSHELSDLTERRRGIESAIESFCLINKGEFGKKRSRQFHYGRISFRMAERIEIPEELEDAVISTLKKLGFSDCVETRERLDRNALKKLPDSALTRCGIRRTKEDHFRIDPDLKLIAERIGRRAQASPTFAVDIEKLAKAVKRKERPDDEAVSEGEMQQVPCNSRSFV
jgi:phage host-nuclease inhibitor protein Gam